MHTAAGRWIVTLIGIALCGLAAGCTAQNRLDRQLARANAFYEHGRFGEAVIEYMNVLRQDPSNTFVVARIGLAHFQTGNLRQAGPFLAYAAQQMNVDPEVKIRLGTIYLLGRDADRARDLARAVLLENPLNEEAVVLLADAALSADDIAEALAAIDVVSAPVKPMNLQLARGNLLIRRGDRGGAEAAFLAARTADSTSEMPLLALSNLYRLEGNTEKADDMLAEASRVAPSGSPAHVELARHMAATGNVDGAEALLTRVTGETPANVYAWLTLGRVRVARGRYDEAMAAVDAALKASPGHPDAILLKSSLLSAKGQHQAAVEELERLVSQQPRVGALKYELARAYLRVGDVKKAGQELRKAVMLNPELIPAILLLAQLDLRRGEPRDAVAVLEDLVERHPNTTAAYVLLGEAYRAANLQERARATYRQLVDLKPDDPEGYYLLGVLEEQEGRTDAALQAYADALKKKADYAPALQRLMAADLRAKDLTGALNRVRRQIEAVPDSAPLYYLLGRAYMAGGNLAAAEEAFNKVLELQPRSPSIYLMLGRLSAQRGNEAEALNQLQAALEINPRDVRSWMLTGLLRQHRGEVQDARQAYERALEQDPNLVAAANNLAYLYAEEMNDLAKGQEWARKAHDMAPADPYIADTLGWILARQGDWRWALSLLRESVVQLAEEPEILYHLGVAELANGDEKAARQRLTDALAAGSFRGSNVAAEVVAILDMPLDGTMTENQRAVLEKVASGHPGQAAALTRLAAREALDGQTSAARRDYEAALAVHADYFPAMVGLARLLADIPDERGRAIELLKTIRDRQPGDVDMLALLGWTAFQNGDVPWGLSLIEQAVGQRRNATMLYRLGLCRYAGGQVESARTVVQQALAMPGEWANRKDAETFLFLTDLEARRAEAEAALAAGQEVLQADPGNLAARVLVAEAKRTLGHEAAATAYEEITVRYPTFVPAFVALAEIYASRPDRKAQALEIASRARKLAPHDARLAGLLGKMAFLNGKYEWAEGLLREAIAQHAHEAESEYYLGCCRAALGDADGAAKAWRRALELGPDATFAADARARLDAGQ